MAAPTLERLVLSIFAGMGDIDGLEDIALDIDVETSGLVNHVYRQPLEIAASGSTNVNLSSIFEGVAVVAVADVTLNSAGLLQVGGNTDKFILAANGTLVMHLNVGSTPPTVYLTAPAGETKYVEIVAIGKRA